MKAIEAADYLVRKSLALDERVSKIKLHKLLFFAQEEFLYRFEKPLFDDEIVAETHGAFVPPVAQEIKGRFKDPDGFEGEGLIDESILPTPAVCQNPEKDVLDFILLEYGNKTQAYLVRLNHTYQIWKDAAKDKSIITKKSILHYKKQCELVKQRSSKHARDFMERSGL